MCCDSDGKVSCSEWKSGVIPMEKCHAPNGKGVGYRWNTVGKTFGKRNLYAYGCEMLSMETQARREANHIGTEKSVNNVQQKI
jgi:hypothetical protein